MYSSLSLYPTISFQAILSGEGYYHVQLAQDGEDSGRLVIGQFPAGAVPGPDDKPPGGYKSYELTGIRAHGDGSITGNGPGWVFVHPSFKFVLDQSPSSPTLEITVSGSMVEDGTKILNVTPAVASSIAAWIKACKFPPA